MMSAFQSLKKCIKGVFVFCILKKNLKEYFLDHQYKFLFFLFLGASTKELYKCWSTSQLSQCCSWAQMASLLLSLEKLLRNSESQNYEINPSRSFILSLCVSTDFEGMRFVLGCHTWHPLADEAFQSATKEYRHLIHILPVKLIVFYSFLVSSKPILPSVTSPEVQQLELML